MPSPATTRATVSGSRSGRAMIATAMATISSPMNRSIVWSRCSPFIGANAAAIRPAVVARRSWSAAAEEAASLGRLDVRGAPAAGPPQDRVDLVAIRPPDRHPVEPLEVLEVARAISPSDQPSYRPNVRRLPDGLPGGGPAARPSARPHRGVVPAADRVERPLVQSRDTVSGGRVGGGDRATARRPGRRAVRAGRRAAARRAPRALSVPQAAGAAVPSPPGPPARGRTQARFAGSPMSSQAALMAAIRAAASSARRDVRVVFPGEPPVRGHDDLVLGLGIDLEGLVRVDGGLIDRAPVGAVAVRRRGPGCPDGAPARAVDRRRERLGRVRAQPPEQVAHDVAEGRRDRQGQDRAEEPGQRPADDDREDDRRRVQLDRVALDLRARGSCSRPAGPACTGRAPRSTASIPAVAASSTAGMAEMIGPMIGTSSRTPAITDSRIAYRPKIGSTELAQDHQADERQDADREAEDELAADPLAEDAPDDPDDRPDVEPPGRRQRSVELGRRARPGP